MTALWLRLYRLFDRDAHVANALTRVAVAYWSGESAG